jgi:sugar transferase (PEP-CTERM system associated)
MRLLNVNFPTRTVFLVISEACLVTIAFVIASIVRLGIDEGTLSLEYEQGFLKILAVAASFMICMYYFDLYDSSILTNRREGPTRLVEVLGSLCLLLAFLYYVYPPLELGRGILAVGFVLLATLLFLWRRAFLKMNTLPQFAQRTLILGDGPLANPLVRELQLRPELGLRVVAPPFIYNHGSNLTNSKLAAAPEKLGGTALQDELDRAVESLQVKRVVVTMGERRGMLPVRTLLSLKSRGIIIQDGIDLYETVTGKVPIESLRLGWLLFSPGFNISRGLRIYKRFASLAISVSGLALSLPLLPFIALSIKLDSRGPLLYRQKRVGLDGIVFDCYKFRTMGLDAEADSGPTWAGDDDPRITRVGWFLRRSRIDEIPQLWNVLKGDMHLIGPRPERPEFTELLDREIPHYYLRHVVRPGITGWAQIRYRYGSSIEDAKEKLRYDLFYVKNISFGLDFLIFLDTVKIIILGRGAK